MMKRYFRIALAMVVCIVIVIAIRASLFPPLDPPRGVWISDDPYIVIFQHRRYNSPFGHFGRQGYMVDENGVITYFFALFFDGKIRFLDAQTFFESDVQHEPVMYGNWRRTGWRRRQFTFEVDGEVITFTRTRDYEPPNTFAWNPGIETLHGVWETEDGRLRLDLEELSLLRPDRFEIIRYPLFQGVYDPGGANIVLLISGSFSPHTGQFSIVIRENGTLRGQSSAPEGGGRFIRADGTLDGDAIHLQTNHRRFATISGDWRFPNEFTLYRISP